MRRLVAESDVVIDNFGVGVMADLGFGVDDLRAINPDVIVASLSGYGQTGPSAGYMAYGPAGGSFSGLYAANGYEGGPADRDRDRSRRSRDGNHRGLVDRRCARGPTPDRRSGSHRCCDGRGDSQHARRGLDGATRPRERHPPAEATVTRSWAPHNCYPTAAGDEWLTIACPSDEALAVAGRLHRSLDRSLADDVRFATIGMRKRNEAELDELIAAWTITGERWDLTQRLQAAGVAAMPSISPLELWQGDPSDGGARHARTAGPPGHRTPRRRWRSPGS